MVKFDKDGGDMALPSYPDGRPYVYLSEEQVEALGLSESPPKAGTEVTFKAIARVRDMTQRVGGDKDDDAVEVSMCLVITDMEMLSGGAESDPAAVLYGA